MTVSFRRPIMLMKGKTACPYCLTDIDVGKECDCPDVQAAREALDIAAMSRAQSEAEKLPVEV